MIKSNLSGAFMGKVEQQSNGVGLHTIFDAVLIILGSMLVIGWIQLPIVPLYVSVIAGLVGSVAVASPEPSIRRVAIGVMLFALYSILRSADIVSLPLIQYGVALVLIAVGVISIVRDIFAQNRHRAAS